jgi:dTDP-glucose 4,6-dehydratase
MSNAYGVLNLLNIVRHFGIEKFVNVSTDEVYGTLNLNEETQFVEDTPINPNSPYAATKAAADMLCRAHFNTYNTPVIVSRCSNNYGPFQYPEKLIPSSIFRLLNDHPILIHGNGLNVRDWIHVSDHCSALDLMLHECLPGQVYNVGAENERNNLDIAKMIIKLMDKSVKMIQFVEDRLGNDARYSIDASKLKRLGWKPVYTRAKFEQGLSETIKWYLTHTEWVETLQQKHQEAYELNHTYSMESKETVAEGKKTN